MEKQSINFLDEGLLLQHVLERGLGLVGVSVVSEVTREQSVPLLLLDPMRVSGSWNSWVETNFHDTCFLAGCLGLLASQPDEI